MHIHPTLYRRTAAREVATAEGNVRTAARSYKKTFRCPQEKCKAGENGDKPGEIVERSQSKL
jgi:hypothetical protein